MENPIKMDDLGVPPFLWNTHIWLGGFKYFSDEHIFGKPTFPDASFASQS